MSLPNQKEGTYKMTPGIFQVESILQRGRSGNQIFYLVKWKGYPESQATWEPQSNLSGCKEAIIEFQNIIKSMEEQKSQTDSAKRRKQIKEREKKFLTSQSKELSQEQPLQSNKTNKLNLRKSTVKDSEDIKSKKNQQNKIDSLENKIIQTFANSSTSNQNDPLESTTAQTIPSKKPENPLTLINQSLGKSQQNHAKDVRNVSINQKQQDQPEVKMDVFTVQPGNPKRQKNIFQKDRQDSDGNLKRSQRIRKKNKKSLQSQDDIKKPQHQPKIQQNRNNIDKKSRIIQNNQQKQERKIEKQPLKTLVTNSKLQIIKTQQRKQGQNKNPDKHFISQRSLLCDQEFQQLTNQLLVSYDDRLRPNIRFQSDQKNIQSVKKILQKFIDLTSPQFASLNQKVRKLLLNKKAVQKLDEDGEFLYCKIQTLIKTVLFNQQEKQIPEWISVLKNYEPSENKRKQDCYFVRIDDLTSELWKKKFRKFISPNL